jgi:hypothetical protein
MKTKTICKKDGTVDARFLPTFSAPMVTVPPPTEITAKDRVARALAKIESAIERMKGSNVYHTPLWSDLQDARLEASYALSKL